MGRGWQAILVGLAACGGTEPAPPPADLEPIAEVPIPATYGIHDTFVRDGLAFVSAWHAGLRIYDVGNGVSGGTPAAPVLVSAIQTSPGPLSGPAVHNAWWFHNPVRNERRYVFVGQEGPALVGAQSSGDIRVVDVSDLQNPVEVAFYHRDDAGTHNFWIDEAAQVLYAAYYNAGVIALDISGTLSGNLANRVRAVVQPGGGLATWTWGVMLSGGRLYASDILSGFWQLNPTNLGVVAGGNNVPDRYTSDLWVHQEWAYTGTWGGQLRDGNRGDMTYVWQLTANGAPVLADSIAIAGVLTVSDVEVSADGRLLVLSTEDGPESGLYFYRRTDPKRPTRVAQALVPEGFHTVTFGRVGGRLYAFAARNPPAPALVVYDLSGL